MSISIGRHFTTRTLLGFAFPSIAMMVFMSLYTIIDGMFVSQFLGSDALSSVNIVLPIISLFVALGVMLATGGCAIIAKKMGENNLLVARQNLTLFVVVGTLISIILAGILLVFINPLVKILGANADLLNYCIKYLRITLLFAPVNVLQLLFLSYFIAASRPGLGFGLTVAGGVTNMVLDYVFLGILGMGIEGAAIATGIGQAVPAIIGLLYFAFGKNELRFTKFSMEWDTLLQACANGSSEMVSNLSNAIITFLFNILMMRLVGAHGVAAITIVLYGQFLFNSLYLGFSMGVGPIISYNLGSKNQKELRHVFKLSAIFVISTSIFIAILSAVSAKPITAMFVDKGSETYVLASTGFALFSINYFFSGFNIFVSSLFTALSDGKSSALISFSRTFLCTVIFLLVLPIFFGVTGVWLAVPVAEVITILLSLYLLVNKNKIFHYFK